MIASTPLVCALSARTASGMSPRNSVELGHGSGSLRVVDATYLGALLSASLNGPPWLFQCASRPSYVRRPKSHPAKPPPAAIRAPIALPAASPAVKAMGERM